MKKYYIALFLLGTLLLVQACEDDEYNKVCIKINQDLCPGAFSGATPIMKLKKFKHVEWWTAKGPNGDIITGTGSLPPNYYKIASSFRWEQEGGIITSSATDDTAYSGRTIEGYEVNYGFWSKDSYIKYTPRSLFEKRWGRYPTAQEESAITNADMTKWFHDIHDQNYSIAGFVPAYDLKIEGREFKKYCFDMNQDTKFEGELVFADGTKCKLSPMTLKERDYDFSTNPHTVSLAVQPVCPKCNN